MSENKNAGGIPADQLKDILSTVIQEARKPIVTDADRRKEAGRLVMKDQELENLRAKTAAEEQRQTDCSHSHRNGSTRTVLVQPGPPGSPYRICQFCQIIIRPETNRAMFLYHEQHSALDIG